MAGADLAPWFVARAVQAYGGRVLADSDEMDAAGPQAVGRDLARLIFGSAGTGTEIPAHVVAVIDRPGSIPARAALEARIEELLEADPVLAAAAAGVLGGYYRQQLESGDGEELAELGDLLWRDEPELARTAFERAVDAGNRGALIRLAMHRRVVFGDYEGALALYRQAAASPDPGVAAGALAALGDALRDHGDYQGARTAWEQCIAIGDPDGTPRAMTGLAGILQHQLGDRDGARAMFQAAFDTGHPEHAAPAMLLLGILLERSGDGDGALAAFQRAADAAPPGRRGNALYQLADLLERRGDAAGAKAVWRQVIDTETDDGDREGAFLSLVNQLGGEGDLDGLRAAHHGGIASGVPGASYALVVIGKVLRDRGDLGGWRDAWQQAVDVGYEDADGLLEELSPSARDEEDDEPAGVPSDFDPRNLIRTGIAVLRDGLPPLPEVLTHRIAVPMAYWTARETAVVLFLRFRRHRRTWDPMALMATFTRRDGEWEADRHWHSTGFHDPFTDPGGLHGLGGEAIVHSGGSGTIWHGTASGAVKDLALIQDGHEDRRPLDNHFGAWVVRAEKPGPFRVAAIDENGTEIKPRSGRH
jgi:tetratricopeptide (TPR) repeat protein